MSEDSRYAEIDCKAYNVFEKSVKFHKQIHSSFVIETNLFISELLWSQMVCRLLLLSLAYHPAYISPDFDGPNCTWWSHIADVAHLTF